MKRQKAPLSHEAVRTVTKIAYISVGLVISALGLYAYVFARGSGHEGVRSGESVIGSPPVWVAFLLGVVGCIALCYCVTQLAIWCKRLATSDLVARDYERCFWYRRQRHAFGNHMQVVLGLLALKRSDEAREYLMQVTESLRSEETTESDSGCPELDSLLKRKVAAAKMQGIDVSVLTWSKCHGLEVSLFGVCRTVGYALDLAIEFAASCVPSLTLCVSNSVGHATYSFIIEWAPAEDRCVSPTQCVETRECSATAEVNPLPGLSATHIASLSEEARLSGGVLSLLHDGQRGFIELTYPAISAGSWEKTQDVY